MCPLWPLHLIILYLLALGPLWVLCQSVPNLIASFDPKEIELNMGDNFFVHVNVSGTGLKPNDEIIARVDKTHIADTEWNTSYRLTEDDANGGLFTGLLKVNANFIELLSSLKLHCILALTVQTGLVQAILKVFRIAK
ncbi:unnamed protein product [Colias eurytheme]|nr:unnamed protein product [Colias eurytheme]